MEERKLILNLAMKGPEINNNQHVLNNIEVRTKLILSLENAFSELIPGGVVSHYEYREAIGKFNKFRFASRPRGR